MVLDKALSVEEICNKLRPIFGKKIDEIYFQYSIADSREEREEMRQRNTKRRETGSEYIQMEYDTENED